MRKKLPVSAGLNVTRSFSGRKISKRRGEVFLDLPSSEVAGKKITCQPVLPGPGSLPVQEPGPVQAQEPEPVQEPELQPASGLLPSSGNL